MREELTADPGTCGVSDAAHEGRNGHHASGVGGIGFRRYGGVEGGLNDDFAESYDSDGDGDGDGASGEPELHVFIGEFFRNHEDSTLGNFACSAQKVTNDRLEAKIALAPFDLGVAETFVMYSSPSEIGGIDVVTVEITREGGSDRNFMRANRRFVDEMRNQFLLWPFT